MTTVFDTSRKRNIDEIVDGEIVVYESSSGGVVHPVTYDPTHGFHISDIDDSSDPSYFGFVDLDGNWYILQYAESTNSFRYATGTSDYAANWVLHVPPGLSYGYFDAIF